MTTGRINQVTFVTDAFAHLPVFLEF